MTKFVAVLFLPVIAGTAALLTRPDRARLYRDWRVFAWAGLLAAALIGPWFAYQWLVRPQELVHKMFDQHVYQRLTGVLDPAHLHPWSFYFTELLAELRAAGTILLTVAGSLLILGHTVSRRWVEGAVVLLWFAVPVAVISAGTSKLYHYACSGTASTCPSRLSRRERRTTAEWPRLRPTAGASGRARIRRTPAQVRTMVPAVRSSAQSVVT